MFTKKVLLISPKNTQKCITHCSLLKTILISDKFIKQKNIIFTAFLIRNDLNVYLSNFSHLLTNRKF